MRKRLSVNMAAAGLAALTLGGCFSPQPDPSKFFVLAPAATGGANSIAPAGLATSSSPTIGLGPIKLPQYLDRDEVVTRVGPNRLELSDRDRWAEPLADNFKQVLAQDLTHSLVLDGSGKLLYANDSNVSEQAQPGEPVAAVLSRTVDDLARQIASAIQSLPRRQPGQV
jgi:uncharacterized lipoprotein YmbA